MARAAPMRHTRINEVGCLRLLVIEDQEQTSRLLRRGLGEAGFVVDVAHDGLDGLHMATSSQYDAIILDIMMPRLDGWTVLAGLRESDRRTPALVLSARESVDDRVRGLSLGADDYLVKPFSFDELLARVRALLRRRTQHEPTTLAIADLSMDPGRLTITRAGQQITLGMKEYQLLELLVRHQGEVLSRNFIAERVWDMSFDSDSNVIEVNIRRLRKKIDDGFERQLIHTVRGRGYVVR
jgi:two-component system, OmpR family, copper resistance phosphate regulon response regulator CusR